MPGPLLQDTFSENPPSLHVTDLNIIYKKCKVIYLSIFLNVNVKYYVHDHIHTSKQQRCVYEKNSNEV